MPARGVGVTDQSPASGVAEVHARERGIPDTGFATTTTADPGAAGTTLAITAFQANWPGSGTFKLRVENEVMYVTAGHGTTSLTVTRGQDGTTAVAHTTGVAVQYVMAQQVVIPQRERVLTGVYLTSFVGTVLLAADTPPAGRFWMINPVGSTVSMALRRVEFMSQHNTALLTPTGPRIGLRLFTFTGTASGGTQTPAKAISSYAAATGSFRTANTGLTITSVADFFSFFPSVAISAAGAAAATAADWNPEDEGMIVLGAGEGILCYQQDAGTSSDTRRWVMNLAWEEYTIP